VKYDYAAVDERAIENPRNSLRGFDPEFEQSTAHSTGVRHSQVWPEWHLLKRFFAREYGTWIMKAAITSPYVAQRNAREIAQT
jgi:hypothetical protein